MSTPEKQQVSISVEVLKELLAEARKPVKTEEQIRAEQQRIADRAALGKEIAAAEAMRVQNQKDCTHMRRDGSTTATYVTGIGALYCQACSAVIRGNEQPELFNRLFQLTQ